MDIAEKKEEILRLVEKLRLDPTRRLPSARSPSTAPARSPSAAPARSPSTASAHRPSVVIPMQAGSDRLARRRNELAELQRRRDKTGLDLLEQRLLSICEALEQRIARIELVIEGLPPEGKPVSGDMASGTELASYLDSETPDTKANVAAPATQPNVRVSKNPSAPPKIEAGSENRRHLLSGRIQGTMLPDFLQLVSSNDKTGIFALEHDGERIELFFSSGHLCHAQSRNMSGQSAFFAAMAFEDGTFSFEETQEVPEEKTIDGNTQFMILEALRQIDEERSGR